MRYLVALLIAVWFVACFITGCSKYRSKDRPVIEESFSEYTYKDFEEVNNQENEESSVYHIKFIHINL